MAKLSWNEFIAKHKKTTGYVAAVSSALPKGLHFDRNKKKLPTPYGLFQEWAAKSLSGDWTSTKVPGGFIICVESQADASTITHGFGVIRQTMVTPACANTTQIGYHDSDYAALAKALGYSV